MNPLIIINFLKSKVGFFLIGSILVFIGLFSLYHYIYDKGFNAAKNEDRNQYNEQLTIALNKQKTLFDEQLKKAQIVSDNEQRIKTVYVEKIKTIDKIIEKPIYKECKMEKQDFEDFNKALGEIK